METSRIQTALEDNAKLLKVVMEKQNMGRWQDCEEYQRILHKNLSYLAALADHQNKVYPQQKAVRGGSNQV
ncbi:hypothetical protein HOP50_01g07020 [Chloropicon primus]|uniref:SS18 N-terminal domain-containing protein n=1 Tax=Chloropicon primus TaxID=1764295 RepID=A0A5B8MCR1_9CHLO|nr:hypothetical protein A3770_01p07170 [Chloropicon primus]UPQ97411.1 hypothetical protein HOP50_01g07020 [Chloropicon primus]|eukprot:QDZ18199.1 hypothetical protein A3770_01p07170 [Chloropicon primus]